MPTVLQGHASLMHALHSLTPHPSRPHVLGASCQRPRVTHPPGGYRWVQARGGLSCGHTGFYGRADPAE